jgi:Tol biopolymer transport system component
MVADGSKTDAWIDDLETGTLSRLTSTGNVTFAQWSRDGKSVVYSAPSGSKWGVWEQSAGGGTKPVVLLEVPSLTPAADLAPDGHSALLGTLTDQTWDVQIVRLDSSRVVQPFHATRGTDTGPRISPDGRWAAVVSDETGTVELYVRSYPDPAVKVQVSVGGGYGAVWSADGSRLYYSTGTVVVEARIVTTPGFRVLSRDTAFTRVPNTFIGGNATYDITRDGSRLVIPSTPTAAYPLIVVPNWRTELRERLAANRK